MGFVYSLTCSHSCQSLLLHQDLPSPHNLLSSQCECGPPILRGVQPHPPGTGTPAPKSHVCCTSNVSARQPPAAQPCISRGWHCIHHWLCEHGVCFARVTCLIISFSGGRLFLVSTVTAPLRGEAIRQRVKQVIKTLKPCARWGGGEQERSETKRATPGRLRASSALANPQPQERSGQGKILQYSTALTRITAA